MTTKAIFESTDSLLHVDQRVERTTAAFEKAAVLFNMAAAMSADAAAADLTSDAGCKHAARRYQVPHGTLCSWLLLLHTTWRCRRLTTPGSVHLQTAVVAHWHTKHVNCAPGCRRRQECLTTCTRMCLCDWTLLVCWTWRQTPPLLLLQFVWPRCLPHESCCAVACMRHSQKPNPLHLLPGGWCAMHTALHHEHCSMCSGAYCRLDEDAQILCLPDIW
jgi:hypothetical protein